MGLQQKTLTAVKWNLLSTVVNTLIGIISLWALSHILSVEQYGIISATLIVTSFCSMLLDFGISNSVVRSKVITSNELSSLYCVNIMLGLLLFIFTFLFSSSISSFFKAGGALTEQIKVISFGFFIISFGLQPKALMTRDMNFDCISKIMMVTTLVNFLSSIILAFVYKQVWCIAISYLISNFIGVLYTNILARKHLDYNYNISFNFKDIKKHISYGAQLVCDSLINQVSINTYPVLMSRLVSISAIGGYNIAYSISISLFERLNPVLSHALFPALSKISDDDDRLCDTFLKVVSFGALVNFPILLGMYVISDDVIQVFFDDRWFFVIPIIKVLCIVGAIRSLDTPVISILLVKAKMYRNVYMGLFKLVIGVPLAFFMGHSLGILGIVYSFLIIQVLNTFFSSFFLIKPALPLSLVKYFISIIIPFVHVSFMVVIISLARYCIHFNSSVVELFTLIIIGFSSYSLIILISPFTIVKEFKKMIFDNMIKKIGG